MATLAQRGRRGLAGARRGSRWVGRARVAAGSFAADDAGAAWRPTRTRLRPWLVLRSDSVYSAVLTVAITLASAAPIRVPATPKNDAATAEDTAASALAATWTGLSCVRFGASVKLSGRTVVSVRGEDMSSGGTRRCTGEERDQRRSLPPQATGPQESRQCSIGPGTTVTCKKVRSCDSDHFGEAVRRRAAAVVLVPPAGSGHRRPNFRTAMPGPAVPGPRHWLGPVIGPVIDLVIP